jgi:hypothetical protein
MPIILAVAKRFGMDDDLRCRIYAGWAVVPVNDPRGGLQCRRVIIGDIALQLFAPLAPLRLVLRYKVPDARRLFRSALNLLMHLVRLSATFRHTGSCPLLICSSVRLQSALDLCLQCLLLLAQVVKRPAPFLGRMGGPLEAV